MYKHLEKGLGSQALRRYVHISIYKKGNARCGALKGGWATLSVEAAGKRLGSPARTTKCKQVHFIISVDKYIKYI